MKIRYLFFFLVFFSLSSYSYATFVASESSAAPENTGVAYGSGERLVYKLSYLGVPAGSAVMEVLEKTYVRGRSVYPVLSTVESNKFVSVFYPVKDRIETFIDVEDGYSHGIRIDQHQGRKRRNKVIDFDQVRHRATQFKNNKVETFRIPPRVQDSLSSLYYFRNQATFEVGKSTFIDVHESNKNWELEIKVLGKEEITTPLGTFKTFRVKAYVRYEGLFMDKGDVTLWLTDDARHIPVLIKTKIKIGSITAVLESSESPTPTYQAKAHIHKKRE